MTNKESRLYKDTKSTIDKKRATKSKKMLSDPIGRDAVKMLKGALYGEGDEYDMDFVPGIWDIDNIPKGKRTSLKNFYDVLLGKSN